jgi:hypothetical protein
MVPVFARKNLLLPQQHDPSQSLGTSEVFDLASNGGLICEKGTHQANEVFDFVRDSTI